LTQTPDENETAAMITIADPADAGCRDHVFQETDFRGVDLLAADFDTGMLSASDKLLSSADKAPGDVTGSE